MRSVKLLWGVIAVLLAAVLALTMLLGRSGARSPKAGEPPSVPEPSEQGTQQSKVVAVIGGRTITAGQLQQRLADKYGAEMVNLLLDREAIRLEAEQVGVTVSREEIEAELQRMQAGYENETQFYKSMKEQLGLSKSELNEDVYYKLLLEHLALRNIQVSEAQIDAYIKEHPEEFKNYVQFHLLKIEVKTKDEAARIVQDLQNGADFSSLARKLSIDSSTSSKGGDMGWVEENDSFLPSIIIETARGLKPNEYSKPIMLKGTAAVILLKEKKEIKRSADSQQRAYIRKELGLQQATPLQQLVRTLREKRQAEILDPELR
ncbi:peptidylprolyl isomerase [Paenibacillus hodogayensis]|uniref:peptidylprolyl isomerase n=1 Tax=Paenibacillus hodogayensis TaxID=279208 RepID=A0ABV5W6Y9_9BACL